MPTMRKLIEREMALARRNLPSGMPMKPAVMVMSLKGIGEEAGVATEFAGGVGEAGFEMEGGEELIAQQREGVVADGVAQEAACDGGQRGDDGVADGVFGLGQAHEAEHGVRRDREEAGFDEGEEGEPILREGAGGFGHGPIIEAAQHRAWFLWQFAIA
jgi:hypothetical protein